MRSPHPLPARREYNRLPVLTISKANIRASGFASRTTLEGGYAKRQLCNQVSAARRAITDLNRARSHSERCLAVDSRHGPHLDGRVCPCDPKRVGYSHAMHWFDPPKARTVQRSVVFYDALYAPQSSTDALISLGEGSD